MDVLILGAGRMGRRHAMGAAKAAGVDRIVIADISEEALKAAAEQVKGEHVSFVHMDSLDSNKDSFDVVILAATAQGRKLQSFTAMAMGARYLLLEKPLGQSMNEVLELSRFLRESGMCVYVNLNMRMYDAFKELKHDLKSKPQLAGYKTLMINTGSIGIGANGIHYLDLCAWLLDAHSQKLLAGEIEEDMLPSGRGPGFGDFGGWVVVEYYDKAQQPLGKAMLSISAKSTAFGGWDIVAPHGRITLHEIEQKRIDTLRIPDSAMPMNRYAADYLPPDERTIESPFLGDLTCQWLEGIAHGMSLLPEVDDTLAVHELMF